MSLHDYERIMDRLKSVEDPAGFLINLFAHAPVGFAVWTADGTPLLTNKAFMDIFLVEPPPEYNVLRDELLAKNGMLPLFQRAFRGETVHVPTYWYDPREHTSITVTEGRRVAISMTIFPLFKKGGDIDYVAATYKDETEIALANERLELEKERLRLAHQAAGIGMFEWNVQSGVNTWTPELEAMYGLTPGEFGATQQSWEQLVHPDDRAEAVARVDRAFETFLPIEGEWRVKLPDGSVRWIAGRFQVMKDDAGKPQRLLGVNLDITDRKREDEARRKAEEAVKESEEALRITLDSIGDAVIASDARGRVVRMNPVAEELTGWPAAEARGRPLAEVFRIIHEETRQLAESPVERVLREGIVVGLANHTALVCRDGTERAIADSGAPIRDAEGALRGVVLVFRDQTDERLAERALQESEERLRATFEQAAVGVARVAPDGRWLEVNERLCSLLGYTREELLQKKFQEVTYPRDLEANLECYRKLLAREIPTYSIEKRYVRKDGTLVWVDLNVSLVRDVAGAPKYFVSMVQDISARKKAEAQLAETAAQLRQAQKMEAVGRLAGGVAHDFNNMLTPILSYADLILGDLKRGDPIRDDVVELRRAAEQAHGITQQLLAFSREKVIQPRAVDLNASVSAMERLLRRVVGEHINLRVRLSRDLDTVYVDPGEIEQVLMNLAMNARDAMPTGGDLSIETKNVVLDEDYAQKHVGAEPGPHVMLAVSDTGAGMNAETRSRAFEPFFTTKKEGKGTGLGLAIVFATVTKAGGNIWVYSEPGQGTSFKLYFPRHHGRVAAVPVPPAATAVKDGGMETVLLVEDDDLVRRSAVAILRRGGYTVLEARSGGEAVVISEKHRGAIDLMLTDVVMPNMGGRELAERLTTARPDMKVLYMSGYTSDSVLRQAVLDAGAAFVQKPFTPDALARSVRKLLDDAQKKR